jgi:hypothetical protein
LFQSARIGPANQRGFVGQSERTKRTKSERVWRIRREDMLIAVSKSALSPGHRKGCLGIVDYAQQAAGKNLPHFQGDITVTMKKGLVGRTLGALLALALGSCFNYSYTWARDSDPTPVSQQEQIGAIKRIMGNVSIRRVGESPQAVKENDAVFLQDILRTDRAGKAWWRSGRKGSPQQGDASLGNSSLLEFVRFDQEGSSSDFSGEVDQGIVRFIRDLPKSTPRSHFIISTPTAIIEVLPTDRPADFVVEVSKDQKLTTVYGIWGGGQGQATICGIRSGAHCAVVSESRCGRGQGTSASDSCFSGNLN